MYMEHEFGEFPFMYVVVFSRAGHGAYACIELESSEYPSMHLVVFSRTGDDEYVCI